jgi:uncharacterized protein
MGAMKGILSLCMGLALSGCSGLLYHPTRGMHFDPAQFGLQPEEVSFPSGDGTALHGWYFKNRGGTPPLATVVFFHGNAQNISSHYLNLVWLLDYPFDFFIFDYRGYGESEGSPSPQGTVLDGVAALEWAHARGAGPLVVFGQSLGGAVALSAVAETAGRLPIRLIAVDSTFASYRRMARRVLARSLVTWPFQWLGWLLMSDAHAPDGRIAAIAPAPLLVIHGDKDPIVEIEMGENVFEQAGDPKEFWRIPGGGHTDVFLRQDSSYQKQFVERMERALKDGT